LIEQLLSQGGFPPEAVAQPVAAAFGPLDAWIYEWQDYLLHLPGVNQLRVGQRFEPVRGSDLFLLKFKNQLGLAELQPYKDGRPLEPPTRVEVISQKFGYPADHLAFFKTLLEDLYARVARLPFTFSAETQQSTLEARRPPTPLFILHFLRQNKRAIEEALNTIQAHPHRVLGDLEQRIPLAQVSEVDADVVLDILRNPAEWAPAGGFLLAKRLQGYAPQRVYQRLPEESLDTPENRFVLAFLKQLLSAADALPAQPWWGNLPPQTSRLINDLRAALCQAVQHDTFTEVGVMQRLPGESRILMFREGYRELFVLWQQFQSARRPLFAPLQAAIDLRDVATLYEFWVFFALAEAIGEVLEVVPAINTITSDKFGLNWRSEAIFGKDYKLVYNPLCRQDYRQFHSYSVALRPDVIWIVAGQPKVVFDAKFRMTLPADNRIEEIYDEEVDRSNGVPVQEDIYKMHTYRDALGVRAAVSVYPGMQQVFWDREAGKRGDLGLCEILLEDASGVGALPLCPSTASLELLACNQGETNDHSTIA
jgi:hypothetical protein